MDFKPPSCREFQYNQGTLTAITNAWSDHSYYTSYGAVWVPLSKLFLILRTNNASARYQYLNHVTAPGDYMTGGCEPYIRAPAVNKLVQDVIWNPTDGTRDHYARYSDAIYLQLRDHEKLRRLRAEFKTNLTTKIKKLKGTRISYQFQGNGVIYDELTGARMLKKSAEFSHVRSVAIYPEISLENWNGLIVHKSIHKIITDKGVCDEIELLDLCHEKGWDSTWVNGWERQFRLFKDGFDLD